MNSWPDTEPSLVDRLGHADDDEAWSRFDALYRPVVYRFARARGLQHSDAETLVGEVMTRVFRAAKRWSAGTAQAASQQSPSPRPLRFRSWLRRVAENALLNLVTRQLSRRGTGGTSHQLALSGRPRPDDQSRAQWDRQHREHLFLSAAGTVQGQVSEEHWQLFWQTHVDGIPIEQAAQQSGRSIGSVYAIRSRIVRRLRQAVESLERLESLSAGEHRS